MFKLFAGAFASIGMLFGGLFGGHSGPPSNMHMGSTTPNHMGSSTPWMNHGMGSTTPWGNGSSTAMRMPGVFGVVDSINGTSLTVTGVSHTGQMTPGTAMASTTYTVDASNAKIMEKGVTSATVAAIKVGDRVAVIGTVSGTSVTATSIIDGVMDMMHMSGGPGQGGMHHGSTTPPAQGSGGGQW